MLAARAATEDASERQEPSVEEMTRCASALVLGELVLEYVYDYDEAAFHADEADGLPLLRSWTEVHIPQDSSDEAVRFFLGLALPIEPPPRSLFAYLGTLAAAVPDSLRFSMCLVSARFLAKTLKDDPSCRGELVQEWQRGARVLRSAGDTKGLRQDLDRAQRRVVVEEHLSLQTVHYSGLSVSATDLLSRLKPEESRAIVAIDKPRRNTRRLLEQRLAALKKSRAP